MRKAKCIIAKIGIDNNGARIFAKELKKCYEANMRYPLLDNFDQKKIIGYMDNVKYKNGELMVTVYFFPKPKLKDFIKDKIVRYMIYCKRTINKDGTYTLNEIELYAGGLIDKSKDVYTKETK